MRNAIAAFVIICCSATVADDYVIRMMNRPG